MHALSLEYHDVVDGNPDASGFPGRSPASYKLTAPLFEQHLDAIAQQARRPPTRAVDWLAGAAAGRPLFLTFDDGGIGAYTSAASALERRGWRGHFFMTAGQIDAPTFLSRERMRELRDRGHIIGSHSFSHPTRMGALGRAALDDEWRRSVDIISDILAEPVLTASVPGGFYTRPVAEAAAKVGLKVLFTSAPTTRCDVVDGCRVLGRYTVRQWTSAESAGALGAGRWKPRASQWALYSFLNLARTVGGDHYTRLRDRYWR